MELVERSGITYRQANYWTGLGLLCVDCDNPGAGHRRDYPEHEVEVATLVGRLAKAGVDPTVGFYVARELIAFGESVLDDFGESDPSEVFRITLVKASP